MRLPVAPSIDGVARSVEAHFGRILDELTAWQHVLAPLFEAGPVSAAMASAALMTHAIAFLDGGNHVVGGGFVAARSALSDEELYLAWWQGEDRRLLAEPTVQQAQPYDYTRRPWFSNPERTRSAHLTGPYVDFVCTNDYTVTTTAPVVAGPKMVGVVGADTLVETLEAMILPDLRTVDATLVNEYGRAVVSADPHVGPGDRVRNTGRVVPLHGVSWSLVLP